MLQYATVLQVCNTVCVVGVLVGFVGTSSTAALTAAFSVAEKPPPKDMLQHTGQLAHTHVEQTDRLTLQQTSWWKSADWPRSSHQQSPDCII